MAEERDRDKLIELLGGAVDKDNDQSEENNTSVGNNDEHVEKTEEANEDKKPNLKDKINDVLKGLGKKDKENKFGLGSLFSKKEGTKGDEKKTIGQFTKKTNKWHKNLNGSRKKYFTFALIAAGSIILFWILSSILSGKTNNKIVLHQLTTPVKRVVKNRIKHNKIVHSNKNHRVNLAMKNRVKHQPNQAGATNKNNLKPSANLSARNEMAKANKLANVGNMALERFNRIVNKTQGVIVKTTQEQEKKIFDIFKLEPEQEYKLDRLIRIAQKQDKLLKYELEVLKKKVEMERMINKVNLSSTSEIVKKIHSLQNTINEIRGKIRNMNNNVTTGNSTPSHSFHHHQYHHTVRTTVYYNELRNLYLESVGNFSKNKFALFNINGNTIKVAVGQNVTLHTVLNNVESNGVVLSLLGSNRKLFIPLRPIIGENIKYQSVDLKDKGSTSSGTGGASPTGSPLSVSQPPNTIEGVTQPTISQGTNGVATLPPPAVNRQ